MADGPAAAARGERGLVRGNIPRYPNESGQLMPYLGRQSFIN